ncbi:CpaE family protein [Nocardioides sp. DS6]|uniref:CpaE family protein n=1 Tax=Nocardioides eburneus TaxID=3231482 RepID=A0ABV3SWW4_9ACTN
MPVVIEPEQASAADLLPGLPTGTQVVATTDRMQAWLGQHHDEYVVVVGPSMPLGDALVVCDALRTSHPTVSVVLVVDEVTTEALAAAMQAGARDVVPLDEPKALTKAVERAYELFTALRGPSGAAHQGRVITVWSPKGGVGKTTVAVNLALALTEQGARRVCLVDLDLAFGDVAITMQLFPTHTIEHAIGAESSLDAELVDGLLTRHEGSLMVLAAPTHPDVRERISPALVARMLRALRETFDYVVLDTSPSFDEQTLTALDATDDIVLVATLDVPTLKNVKVALETLDLLGVAPDRRHLLLNRSDDEVGLGPERVESILGLTPVVKVASSIDVAASTNTGVPIVTRNPRHPGSVALLQLASHLAGQDIAAPVTLTDQPAEQAPARRFFKRR